MLSQQPARMPRYRFKNWEIEVNFQVNGQDYFLAFSEDEGRWYLLAPTPEGAQRIPVYVDVAKYALSSLRDVEPQTKLSS